jgi:phosphatidylinositol alpha-mannosyltransferase
LVLVGSGLTIPLCRLLAVPLVGKAILFAGQVSPAELPKYYASSDVFCSLPKGSESFGIVLLEAMAAGKPVVGTDIDGYREIIEHGVDGLLVQRGDTESLTQALHGLIRDEGRRHAMGLKGREKARRFDWSRIADSVQAVYNSLCVSQPTKASHEHARCTIARLP